MTQSGHSYIEIGIKQEIEKWDEKSAKYIGDIYTRHCQKSSFTSEIITFLGQAPLQKGASWLLKKHLESSNRLEPSNIRKVYALLKKLEHWETKLHILQSIPYMPIEKSQKKRVDAFLRECLMDSNKFVKAWAYNGFYELSIQHVEYQEETKQLLEMAMRDEPASVKARVRKIMEKGF